ncbi:uncharacterized protein F4822DRAFT_385390 [Hypoxylon trugodes]|uniref:uncharacterized protein n=1 Tax=Hypoxylon trugodes TaxID=326681 RepID=UPI002191BAD6|nr:uncharacterized protein F4822DRAFT_385390 [Hypoxylon trugodes]KAI1393660.1 hypothetical protein F4822DRAFT_385390 [Hypoxylon trugodes]
MKRKAIDEAESLGAPASQKNRIEGAKDVSDVYSSNDDAADDDYNVAEENISDNESLYTGTTSIVPTNDTPLTPVSPARKAPSEFKTIKCTYPDCTKTFNRPVRLAAHLRSHNSERPYKCNFPGCDKDYFEEKHLKQHIKGSHTNEREYACTEPGCGKSFLTSTRLRRHQAVHEGKERFKCRGYPPCEQSFRKHQTLQRHIRAEHLKISAFPCDFKDNETGEICKEGFDSGGALRRHKERDHGEIRFFCDECSEQQGNDDGSEQNRAGFTTIALLHAHIKQCHASCMFCGFKCNGRSELEQHIESEHTRTKSLEERKTVACTWPDCTKTFTKKSNLNAHIRSFHEGVRFVCGSVDVSGVAELASWSMQEGCGESFASKAGLENHVRYVHLKHERPEPPQGPPKPKPQPPTDPLQELTGVKGKTRKTLRCTVKGCTAKFVHNGELEAHLDSEHIRQNRFEQAIMERDPMTQDEFEALDQTMTMHWGGEGNGKFWVGADDANEGALEQGGLDDEWIHDEAEMSRLIDQPSQLEGLIDPALDGMNA